MSTVFWKGIRDIMGELILHYLENCAGKRSSWLWSHRLDILVIRNLSIKIVCRCLFKGSIRVSNPEAQLQHLIILCRRKKPSGNWKWSICVKCSWINHPYPISTFVCGGGSSGGGVCLKHFHIFLWTLANSKAKPNIKL